MSSLVERRRGREHLTVPGGRVGCQETLTAAVAREVEEETGLRVEVGELLYLAEVIAGSTRHELNLFFRAHVAAGNWDDVLLLSRDDPACERVMPPVLPAIFDDLDRGWSGIPRWLGNIHVIGARLP